MKVKEAAILKDELEENIKRLISDFECDSGCRVVGIDTIFTETKTRNDILSDLIIIIDLK